MPIAKGDTFPREPKKINAIRKTRCFEFASNMLSSHIMLYRHDLHNVLKQACTNKSKTHNSRTSSKSKEGNSDHDS
jgi:hypothetical protein